MNCQDLHRLVHAYLDQELDLMTSLDLEAHLKDCGACRAQHAKLRALRGIEAQHLHFHAAPEPLKTRITHDLRTGCHNEAAPQLRAWRAATAVLALSLAALLAWIALPVTSPGPAQLAARSGEKMVYHIASDADVTTALRNVSNHLAVSPGARIIVVAHNNGVDFLLRGAQDRDGSPYASSILQLATQGVDFRVCQNTLTRRQIGPDALVPEAHLVPSGIAEISRLQTQEGYAYMKL